MKFSQWKDIAELIGLAAIIASLVFVGLQLRQSQKIALATQYQARAETTQNLALVHLEAGYVPFIPELRNGVSENVTTQDLNTVLWLWIQFDNHFYQYQSGFLDEEMWQSQWRNTQELYGVCQFRFIWDWRKKGLRSEFVQLVESIEDSCI